MPFNNRSASLKPGLLLLLISIVISMCIFTDYGMAWDEQWQREIGQVNYNYIFNGDHTLDKFIDRDHGAGFELLLTIIEKITGSKDLKFIYYSRHLLANLFYLFSAFCGYALILRLYKNQLLAALGFFMLAYMPRLYAHSYFNTKDIPFMAMCTISFMVSQWAFQKNKPTAFLVLGLTIGYATSIRLQGLLPFAVVFTFLFIDYITSVVKKQQASKTFFSLLLLIIGFCSSCYLFWPTLWTHPLNSLTEVFESLSHYNFIGKILLNGTVYSATDLPWFYIPLWIAVTVPAVWFIAGVVGLLLLLFSIVKSPLTYILNTPQRQVLLHAGCLVCPIILLIALHSVIYDDWRHVYFVYPGLVLTAIYLMHRLLQTKTKPILWILCSVEIVLIILFMILNHPFQNLYFNEFISRDRDYIQQRYELDYWGTSFRPALQYIATHDTSKKIRVNDKECIILNLQLMPDKDRKRFVIGMCDSCLDYNLELFRGGPLKSQKTKNTVDVVSFHNTILRITRPKKD